MRKRVLIMVLVLSMGLLLNACQMGGAAPEVTTIEEENTNPESQDQEAALPQSTETQEPENTVTQEDDAQPTARIGLQGTDPETVQLASGDIQLVEFFAFW